VAKKTMTISITSDLAFHVDKQTVSYEQLEPLIQAQVSNGEELTIMLYADSTVPIQNVISVMDVANRNKVKLVLATEPKKD